MGSADTSAPFGLGDGHADWNSIGAQLTKRMLDQHPVGESLLAVPISCAPAHAVVIASPGGERRVSASDAMGIFDVLRVPSTAKSPVAMTIRIWLGDSELGVSIAPGVELTYLDLARLALQSNRSVMQGALSRGGVPDAFLVPLLREDVIREGAAPRSRARIGSATA